MKRERYIPENSKEIKGEDGVVYTYEGKGRLPAISTARLNKLMLHPLLMPKLF